MTPSEIRAELLGQHARLRSLIDETRAIAERARQGEAVGDALRDGVARLATAMRDHNAREEELLGGILPTVDAWGPARAEIMDETHRREHDELYEVLLGIRTAPRELAGAGVTALFDRLLEHMAREEKTLLGEDVLKDDTVVVEFGG